MIDIIFGIVTFVGIVLCLTLVVLAAKSVLVPTGSCAIDINGKLIVDADVGQRLLDTLRASDINLPGSCGGAGTCGLCRVRVIEGGREAVPQELSRFTRLQAKRGTRLACQLRVVNPMQIEVDDNCFAADTWSCEVLSVKNVSSLIAEIVLKLPAGEKMEFRAGSFVEVTCPPVDIKYADFSIDERFRDVWDKSSLWTLKVKNKKVLTRAYSLANRPGETDRIRLNVRIALPPPQKKHVPPGVVSSWLFSLKPGDTVDVTGPFGFFMVEESDKEAIFIGGGVGMAPLYSQILDLLDGRQSKRKISYWYGARSKSEIYYAEDFERLSASHENFDWHVALSDPDPEEEDWQGLTGFVHQALLDEYLSNHFAPELCEYYICGPPMMVQAATVMLAQLGVEEEAIHFDDFGG